MFNRFSRSLVSCALLLVGSISAAGCGASTGVDEEVDSAEAGVEGSADHAGKPHHRGPGGMIVKTALEELELTADQQTKIKGLFAKDAPSEAERDAHEARAKQLADAVRAGKIDASAFPKPEGKEDKRAAFAADLDALHAVLTADQRSELVAALRDRIPEGPPGEWKGKRHEGEEGKRGKEGKGRRGKGGPMGFLLHGLDVSDEQKASIEKALTDAGLGPKDGPDGKRPDMKDMKEKLEAALDAFVKDDFKAADVLPAPPAEAGPHKFIESLAVIVPLLTDAQREELADRLEEGPMGRGPKGRRGGAE